MLAFRGNYQKLIFGTRIGFSQFLKVAKQNMTSRSDQLSKLRENVKDFPLTLVPDTMDSLDSAFERLSSTYGDPQRLVNHEIKSLTRFHLFQTVKMVRTLFVPDSRLSGCFSWRLLLLNL